MAERLNQFSIKNKSIFVVVGALHVLSSQSLLKELESMGLLRGDCSCWLSNKPTRQI